MGTSIRDELIRATRITFERFAEVMTYQRGDAAPLEVMGIPETILEAEPSGFSAESWGGQKTVEFILDDIGGIDPEKGDKIVIGSSRYQVQVLKENNGITVKVGI